MSNWFRKLWGSSTSSIHPPWHAGQYATYFLAYDDGDWVAFALRLIGKANDGAWILTGDFKTPLGEATTWFRCDPNASPDVPDIVPVRQEAIRKSPVDGNDLRSTLLDPMNMASLAINLFLVRRSPSALKSINGSPSSIAYPCGIDQVYSLISDGLGYQKHHDLSPRVLLTGVACLSIDGGKNPMTVTSFGLSDANVPVTNYDDYVDLSHPKQVVHDGFALSYPATWFLRPRLERGEPEGAQPEYFHLTGGNSCTVTPSVRLQKGKSDEIAEEREALLSFHGFAGETPMGRVIPRQGVTFQLQGHAHGFVSDLDNPGIAGLAYSAIYYSDSGECLADVNLFGCTSRGNPRLTETLAEMDLVFRAILESFRFI